MVEATKDFLGGLIAAALADPLARRRFLEALVSGDVWALLHQPPGEGDARPEHNLIQWQHQASGTPVVPIFTGPGRFPHPLPPPAVLARVAARVLLGLGLKPALCLNALDQPSWTLSAADLKTLHELMAHDGHHFDAHGIVVPWAFRYPSDEAYTLAVAFAEWFTRTGQVDIAYLYELGTAGPTEPMTTFLALDETPDMALADALLRVAESAGAPASFTVRFLPREPAHREGLAGLRLPPFYVRPRAVP